MLKVISRSGVLLRDRRDMFKFMRRTVLFITSAGILLFFGRMIWDMVDSEKLWHPVREDESLSLG